MNTDLEALLAVQQDDAGLRVLGERMAALDAREAALAAERRAAEQALERARAAVEREDGKRGALAARVGQHRQLHQRNVAQLDQVRRLREATAARAQVDMAQQILRDEERELDSLDRRLADLAEAVGAHEGAVAEIDERQRESREQLDNERSALAAEIAAATAERDRAAAKVPRSLLSRYERIRDRRRGPALYALRGYACGSCDTAIPLQRRNLMAEGAMIEVCEGCGVLLYAGAE